VNAPATTYAGNTVNVPVTFSNNGPSTADGVTYSISLPAGLNGVSCLGASCSYNSGTGTVTVTGLPSSLAYSQTVNLTVLYTAPASGSVTVTSIIGTTTNQGANAAPDSAAATTTVTPAADLVITKTVNNATPVVGSNVIFTVTVTNNGPSASDGVTVTDLLPTGYSYVTSGVSTGSYNPGTGTWTIGTLANGGSATMTVTAKVLASGNYSNTATATAITYDPTTPNTATSTPVPVQVADIATTVSAPALANAGSTVSVPVSFSNVGPITADGIVYAATLPAGLSGVSCNGATCNYDATTGIVGISGLPTSLSSGQSVQIVLQYTAPASGTVVVGSTVSTTTNETNFANNASNGSTNITAGDTRADVTTTVNAPPAATSGSPVQVAVGYLNLGPAGADGVTYTVSLPAGLADVSCQGATCSYDSGSGTLLVSGLVASLGNGQSQGVTVQYTAPASGTVTVGSVIATTTAESNTANNTANGSTTVTSATTADVTTTISSPALVTAWDTVNVLIGFSNNGPAVAAGVTYQATLPGGLSGVSCTGATCLYDSVTGVVTIGGLPASLAVGQSDNITLTYTAPVSGTVNIGSSIATTTPEANTANNTAATSTATTAALPGLSIIKKTNGTNNQTAPGPTIEVGTPISWTYDVRNTGNVALTSVTVTDSKGAAVSCPASVLAAGASMTCTASGTAVAGQNDSTGSVTGTAPGGGSVSASDPEHYFGAAPAITITTLTNGTNNDTAPGLLIVTGTALTWTYQVKNTGNVTLTGIAVTDSVLNAVCTIPTLAAGATSSCTKTGTAAAGQHTNTGTATGTDPTGAKVSASNPDNYKGVVVCDANGDGVINSLDINLIIAAMGKAVSAGDPRDYVVDHVITVNDSNGCTLKCTKPNCAL
jgi:uncharacterized repeat protein (TIGR01451 family)